ncbi:MAG TPA: ribosome small subunit-dependent GTPase A [Gaiellaceae bacterium]|nr:ribosome small subunit-dependent GTPase A [Gaiellaceae bacterium]
MSVDLIALGWSPERGEHFEQHAAAGLAPARVGAQHRGAYAVYTAAGERPAEPAGRLRHEARGTDELPAVGDWVAVRDEPGAAAATIHAVLPRATSFSRRAAGREAVEQVVAANMDVVLLVTAFGRDLNLRRLERYLAAGWESGAEPVVVVNKLDLAEDAAAELLEVEGVAFGVPVHAVSCVDGTGVEALGGLFAGNRTVALLGSSGVGKSSLVNRLLGRDAAAVQELRGDGRGRHTTTHRELRPVPGGGAVLDTPGMRELGLWDADEGVGEAFDDVASLAERCRFSDCAHEAEPGCAVLAAVADGTLEPERLESWRKLSRELGHLELKADPRARAEARRRRRAFARSLRKTAY